MTCAATILEGFGKLSKTKGASAYTKPAFQFLECALVSLSTLRAGDDPLSYSLSEVDIASAWAARRATGHAAQPGTAFGGNAPYL